MVKHQKNKDSESFLMKKRFLKLNSLKEEKKK